MNKSPALCRISLPALALLGSSAWAQVPNATYQVGAIATTVEPGTPNDGKSSTGATPRNVAIDVPVHFFAPGDANHGPIKWDLEQRAHAEAFGGESPQAVATAEAKASSSPDNASPLAGSNANALVQYFLHLQTTNESGLVWHPALIPTQFHARGVTIGAGSTSVGVLNVNTGAGLFLDYTEGVQSVSPKLSFDRTAAFSIRPDDYLRVGLSAHANAYADTDPSTDDVISSHSLADPTFSFDQAAFDLYAASQGQPTFNLADFYAFEFSDTIVAPEPSSVTLLAVCAAALAGSRRRQRTGLASARRAF